MEAQSPNIIPWFSVHLLIFSLFGSIFDSLVVSLLTRRWSVCGFHSLWSLPDLLPRCTLQSAFDGTQPVWVSSRCLLWFLFSSFLFFFFSHFLFSLFVLFLHVQFCKANSRYCISQLVSLQRKFTVSCSLLQYSVNGFMIYISIFINLPLSPSPDAFTSPLFFPKIIPIIVESLQTNIRWKDWKVCDIAI